MKNATLIWESDKSRLYELEEPIRLDPNCACFHAGTKEETLYVLMIRHSDIKTEAYVPYDEDIKSARSSKKPEGVGGWGWPTGKELKAKSYEEALEMLGCSIKPYVPPPIIEYGLYDEVLL